jgi:pimeloyl-ACP methyl ester carboxylesterase
MDIDTKMDRRVEVAQAALLARYAPDMCIRRVHWSQGETQVLELGIGSALLFAHGDLSSVFEWVPILPTLTCNHRVIAVDRPGHGLAEPFDYTGVDLLDHARTFLRNILDALEVHAVDVAANSMGGLWTVLFAIDAPGRVSRFALVGTSAGMRRTVPFRLRALGLPLIGQPLGRFLLSKPTRESSRKFWGQTFIAHPEHLDEKLLGAEGAHQRRNLGTFSASCVAYSTLEASSVV